MSHELWRESLKRLRAIADEAGSLLMADIAHIAGLVAAGLHPQAVARVAPVGVVRPRIRASARASRQAERQERRLK